MRRATPRLATLISVAACGLSAGLWLWLTQIPTVRLVSPSGGVAYLHGPSAASLPGFLALGVGGLGLTWIALGILLSRLNRDPLDEILTHSASAFLPLLLLLVEGTRLLLPGWLTNPVVILTYEARWVLAGGVALAVSVLYARLLPLAAWRLRLRPGRLAVLTFVLVSLVYLAFLPRAVLVGPTGDEPDYLLLAHSLLTDRDFDLRNNLGRKDYLRFAERAPSHVRPGPSGGLYDAHRLGLPVIIAPAYGVGLLTAWPVRVTVMVFVSLVAALVAARIVAWTLVLTGHPLSALLTGLAVAFSAPGFFYAYAIYPELPVALIVLEVLRRLVTTGDHAAWTVGLLLASLPWFHERFAPLTLVLAGTAFWAFGRRARVLAGLLIPLAASGLLQGAYYMLLYGRPFPFGVHPGFAPASSIHTGLVGLWLDRDHGLLPLAPVYLLAWAGIRSFLQEQRRLAMMALAAFLSLYGIVGTNLVWWGGFSPAPRYLVSLLPILGLALAFGIREALARGRAIRILILTGTSVLVATYAVVYPALQYRHAHPFRSLFPGIDWARYLPGWTLPDERTLPLTSLALGVIGLLVLGTRSVAESVPAGVRVTVVGSLTLLGVTGVVLAGDHLSGAQGPHLAVEDANRELRTFLFRLDAERALRSPPTLRSAATLPPDPVRLVYEAERLPGQDHRTVQDPLACNGLARVGERAGATLVFGPYETLPRGAYRAIFRLRGETGPASGSIGRLGITAARGRVPLAAREVRGEELALDSYREIRVDFRLDARTRDLEWRVWLEQVGALRVDHIAIIPLGVLARDHGA